MVRPGKTTEEIAEIKALKKEVSELRRANKSSRRPRLLRGGLDRPPRF